MREDFIAAWEFLVAQKNCSGKAGVVGFCFGGSMANMMAVHIPKLAAAVPFYGGQPPTAEVPSIQAPLMLHFAELDTRVNEGWPAYEQALRANGKKYEVYMYPGVNHGFHNNTTPRYDQAAADLAWGRTMRFFRKELG
jgi:carboxymethylenebutenolidase